MKIVNIWISNLTNEDKLNLKYSLILSFTVSIIVLLFSLFFKWWSYTWGFAIMIGYIASSICYIKLANNVTKYLNGYYDNYKRKVFFNHLSSLLIYFIVLTLCVLINVYAMFWCAFGIMSIKIIIYIRYIKK